MIESLLTGPPLFLSLLSVYLKDVTASLVHEGKITGISNPSKFEAEVYTPGGSVEASPEAKQISGGKLHKAARSYADVVRS